MAAETMGTMKLKTAAVFTDAQLWAFAREVAANTADEEPGWAARIQACSAAAVVTGQDPTGSFYYHEGWKPAVDYIFQMCQHALPADAATLYHIYHQLKQAALEHEHDCVVN